MAVTLGTTEAAITRTSFRSSAIMQYLAFSLLAALLLSSCAGVQSQDGAILSADQAARQTDDIGIRVERINLAASGMMLDLRYRITDIEKARKLLTRQSKLYLVDQGSGKVLIVPNMQKVGELRQLPNPKNADRIYWMFFGNPGNLVKSGGRVTLVVGDTRIKDLVVE